MSSPQNVKRSAFWPLIYIKVDQLYLAQIFFVVPTERSVERAKFKSKVERVSLPPRLFLLWHGVEGKRLSALGVRRFLCVLCDMI